MSEDHADDLRKARKNLGELRRQSAEALAEHQRGRRQDIMRTIADAQRAIDAIDHAKAEESDPDSKGDDRPPQSRSAASVEAKGLRSVWKRLKTKFL
jgi:hypothetical protein